MVADLQAFLQDQYGVSELQSVTYGDLMLYADFMGDMEYLEGLSIAQLILRASDTSSDEGEDAESTSSLNGAGDDSDIYGSDDMMSEEGADDPASLVLNSLLEKRFIDLEVSCIDEDGNDMHLPPVRVRCNDSTHPTSSASPSSSRRLSGSSKGPFNLIDMLPKEIRAILKALGKYKPALVKLIRSMLS